MKRLHAVYAAVLLAPALAACDRRDSNDDQAYASAGSESPDDAASRDVAQPTDGSAMPGDAATNAGVQGGAAANGTTPYGGATDGSATGTANGAANGATTTAGAQGANGAASANGMQASGDTMSGTPTAAGSADANFYRQALGSGKGELALSEHATRTASSGEVKRIAEMLVADHRDLNGKLSATSGMGDVQPPPADARAAEEIRSQTGAAFDTAYLQKMSDGHKKSIALYEAASKNAGDAETRRLAAAALPKLREHARHVDRALAAVRGNGNR